MYYFSDENRNYINVCNIISRVEYMSRNGKEHEISNLKEAASLLTKGGTLINEPCGLCHGVQVKFKDTIICINCGNEENTIDRRLLQQQKQQDINYNKSKQDFAREGHLNFAKILIEEKISSIMEQIKNEEKFDILKQKTELAGIFLELLQKIKNIQHNKENLS